MDVAALEAEHEKLERKIEHVKRMGEDDWPVNTVILAEVMTLDDTTRSSVFIKRADDYWDRPGNGVAIKWSQIVQVLFNAEIVRLDVSTGWESFDQIREDQLDAKA